MEKSFYQKTFNLCISLFIIGFLCGICSILLGISLVNLQSTPYLTFFYRFVNTVYITSVVISIITIIVFLVLVGHEIHMRIKQDNLKNLWKSIKQTLIIRMFLKQSEHSETVRTLEEAKVRRYNPINRQFNKSARQAIVDIRTDKIILMIRIPSTQQATKILKDMETLISEEISNRNPDYYFSHPERKEKWLYFRGATRK
ncbi:MAG: hypothetical protein D8H99_12670 [Streptococcus sp.]|nr:MAG: hypothetical protein D8H99_12670 [Streptococcus sp.]